MVLDVNIGSGSLTIDVPDPFHIDLDGICGRIEGFASSRGVDIGGMDIRGLIPKLVRGIAGCEGGCPADAMNLVSRGFDGFRLEYVEGGILLAKATSGQTDVSLRMFPDF